MSVQSKRRTRLPVVARRRVVVVRYSGYMLKPEVLNSVKPLLLALIQPAYFFLL